MDINLRELAYIYQADTPFAEQALQAISLTIKHGTLQAIVGKTGSGKSTLIQLIAGLLRPTQGSIQVGEHIVNAKTKRILFRSQVGVVFQYPEQQLFAETVYRDIAYGPTNQRLTTETVHERVLEAAKRLGLTEDLLERSPFTLSGGQMRRVAIAGVLAMDPAILILDEPTAGLDQWAKDQLMTLLKQIHQQKQVTIILVTHQMEEVAQLADQVIVMEKGHCVYQDSPANLFADQAKLIGFGLEAPKITQLINKLNERLSPPIPTSIFQLSELVAHLEERRQGVKL